MPGIRTIRKLCVHYRTKLADDEIKLFIPRSELWERLIVAFKSGEEMLKLSVDKPSFSFMRMKTLKYPLLNLTTFHLPKMEIYGLFEV